MRTIILALSVSMLFCFACSDNKDNEKQERAHDINALEKSAFADTVQLKVDRKILQKFIEACKAYADDYPKDSLTPQFLFRAARHLTNSKPSEALTLYNRVYTQYNDFEDRPLCLFFQGYIYDDILNEDAKAAAIYKQFLERFPKHDFADDAQACITFIENPDKLEEMFQKNSEEKEDSVEM